MLRLKFFADALKLFFNPLNLLLCRGALLGIQLRRPSACQPPLGAVHNRGYHLQIADQFDCAVRPQQHDLEAATDDYVEEVRRVSLPEKSLAAGQPHPVRLRIQFL